MANIKGITIEIAGNTSKLTKALDESKSALVSTQKELTAVNKLLKLDPTNVTLLSQKQELLSKAIENTKDRLSQLKELQQKFGSQSNLTEEQQEKYRLLEREIAQCEGQLKNYEKQQVNVNDSISNVNNGQPFEEVSKDIEDTGKSALKTGDIIKANLISQAIISGVKKLGQAFKSVSNAMDEWSNKAAALEEQEAKVARVMKNTTNATQQDIDAMIQLTATQEKMGVVSQETQLAGLQELGTYVEQKESLQKLLPVMNDMIAQQYGVGASMESASGIATMMGKVLGNGQVDALSRLGYKFDEAQKKVLKFGTEEEKVEMLTKIITQSVGGMNSALAKTDAGKMAIAKSYFEDFQKTAGKTFNDFKAKVVGTFLPQIMDIGNAFSDMFSGKISIEDGMKKIVSGLTSGLQTIRSKLPEVLKTGTEILKSIVQGITDGLPEIAKAVVEIITQLVEFLIQNLPMILDAVIKIILEVAKALGEQLPTLIPALVKGLLDMVETIIDNVDLFIDAAIQLIMGLADGLIQAIPELIDRIPIIIDKLIHALTENLPKLIQMGMELNLKLAEGLIKAIPDLVKQLPQIITSIVNGLVEGFVNIVETGEKLLEELWNGIKQKMQWLWEKIKGFGESVIEHIEDALGIHGGKKTMMKALGEEMGIDLSEGLSGKETEAELAGKMLIEGTRKGIIDKNAQNLTFKALSVFGNSLINKLKASLQEKSPSKATAEMGKFLDEGLQIGIQKNASGAIKAAGNLGSSVLNSINDGMTDSLNVGNTIGQVEGAMRSLTSGVNASVNPVINPTANTNPLYITIDKFYNNRETDIQQLAEELEFYRKNSALAKGGV